MDLATSPALEAFRRDVRSFIEERMPRTRQRSGVRAPESQDEADLLRRWAADLHDAGFLGASWPEAWGGQPDQDPMASFVIAEEMGYANAPLPLGAGGLAAG